MIDERKAVRPTSAVVHNIILESRKKLSISGVTDIESFNEELVLFQTALGALEIKGIDLHMNKLNLDSGEVVIEGDVFSLLYTEDEPHENKVGLFSRLFR